VDDAKTTLDYVKQIESTDSSFCKIGNSAETLVLSFGHIVHGGFASKTSLINKKSENNNFDVLYMRDVEKKWYLDSLPEIGNSFSDTVNFLESEISKYKRTIYMGSSMGGYASILFASILTGDIVIAQTPQTDLSYIMHDNSKAGNRARSLLKEVKKRCSKTWKLYNNLNYTINDSTYYILGGFGPNANVLHHLHHYENIKSHSNVKRPNYFDFVKEINKHILT
jgi:hypothetical protein